MSGKKKLLLAFVIGSSWPVFIWYFLGFNFMLEHENALKDNPCTQSDPNKLYVTYTRLAPFLLGLVSSVAIYLHLNYNYTIDNAFFYASFVASILTSTYITVCDMYRYTVNRYLFQYFLLIFGYAILFNIYVKGTYKYLMNQ